MPSTVAAPRTRGNPNASSAIPHNEGSGKKLTQLTATALRAVSQTAPSAGYTNTAAKTPSSAWSNSGYLLKLLEGEEKNRRHDQLCTTKAAEKFHRSSSSDHSDDDSFARYSDEGLSEHSSGSPTTATVAHFGHFTGYTVSLPQVGDAVLTSIASFLPLRDLTAFRTVSAALNRAANTIAPNLLSGMVFLRFRKDTNRGMRFTVPPPRHLMRWTCKTCHAANPVGNAFCKNCNGQATDAHGIRRIFVGQLRKERTAELTEFLLASLYPDMEVFHIENHTSKADGRGKGCAWVYVTNSRDEARLLDLNKRMFVDVDNEGREGVWVCARNEVDALADLAGARSYRPARPIVLPRQPLTCERPQGKPAPATSAPTAKPSHAKVASESAPAPVAATSVRPAPVPLQPTGARCTVKVYGQVVGAGSYRYHADGSWSHDPYAFHPFF